MISNGASFGDSKNYGNSGSNIGPADILPSIYVRLLAVGGEIPWRT
jgi:hypothetical protein